MVKIEYKVIKNYLDTSCNADFLNEQGKDGWMYLKTGVFSEPEYDDVLNKYTGEEITFYKHVFYRQIIDNNNNQNN